MYVFSFNGKQKSKCSITQAILSMCPLKSLRTAEMREELCVAGL